MIRAAHWFLDGLESVALTAIVASRIVRGFLLDESPKPKRDPFTGRPETRPN